MLRKRYIVRNKDQVITRMSEKLYDDNTSDKTIFLKDMYKAGIHFREVGNTVQGFYLSEDEIGLSRGSPVRICFTGEFTEENNNTYFDVIIYPKIWELALILIACTSFVIFGRLYGLIPAVLVGILFGIEYVHLTKSVLAYFKELFI